MREREREFLFYVFISSIWFHLFLQPRLRNWKNFSHPFICSAKISKHIFEKVNWIIYEYLLFLRLIISLWLRSWFFIRFVSYCFVCPYLLTCHLTLILIFSLNPVLLSLYIVGYSIKSRSLSAKQSKFLFLVGQLSKYCATSYT